MVGGTHTFQVLPSPKGENLDGRREIFAGEARQ